MIETFIFQNNKKKVAKRTSALVPLSMLLHKGGANDYKVGICFY